jgi:hypothetical protein
MLVVLTEYKVPRELGTLNYIYIFFNWNLGERQQCNTQTQRKLFCVIVQECFDYFADYTTKKIDSTKNRSSHNRSKKSIILAVWIDYCQNRLKIGNTRRVSRCWRDGERGTRRRCKTVESVNVVSVVGVPSSIIKG